MNNKKSFEQHLADFVRELQGKNSSPLTITAYTTDIRQFLTYAGENNLTVQSPTDITKQDITDFLSSLSQQGRSGVTRARKLVALKEFFLFLINNGMITKSPCETVSMPKREKKQRNYLRPDEYATLLSVAGSHPRDFAILQLFLQTGIRVGELVQLKLGDINLKEGVLKITGKGNKQREIDLEKKAILSLKNYLQTRQQTSDDHLFLSYLGKGMSDRAVKKLVEKYKKQAGITKKISCHSLRHTFASYKAEHGVSAFQLQQWLGHASVTTSQIYVHMTRSQNSRKAMQETSL
jgi:site-specific recombinase XerD